MQLFSCAIDQPERQHKHKYPPNEGVHEASISYGPRSLYQYLLQDFNIHNDEYYGIKYNTGPIFLNYKYWIKDWLNLGVSLGYQKYREEFDYRFRTSSRYQQNTSLYTAAIESKIYVAERRHVQFYQLAGLSYFHMDRAYSNSSYYENHKLNYIFFQYAPLGIRLGKDNGCFFELGIGYKGILSGGLFLKINPKSKFKY